MQFQSGDLILNGKYRVERLLGRGAFGEVYLVTHQALQVRRALKVLRRDAAGMGSTAYSNYRGRFALEAQLGARLNAQTPQPHLVQVYDFVDADGLLALEMEYAPGGSLAERLVRVREAGEPIAVDEVVRIAREVAQGLAALHAVDAVHRDVKPGNILFDGTGVAKVGDLGLAQVPGDLSQRDLLGSQARAQPGTPDYMSPEQSANAGRLAPASDVYSLGLVLFEMLTGRIYQNQRPGTRVRALREDVPEQLSDLVACMLAEKPGDRPWDGAAAALLLGEAERHIKAIEAKRQRQAEARARAKAVAEVRAKQKEDEARREALAAKALRATEARERREEEARRADILRRREEAVAAVLAWVQHRSGFLVVASLGIVCLFALILVAAQFPILQSLIASRSPTSTPKPQLLPDKAVPPTATPYNQAFLRGNVQLQNKCASPVRVALSYLNTADQWEYVKWWEIDAETDRFLSKDDVRLVSNNSIFYYYAEAIDGSGYVWNGDKVLDFQGISLETRELRLARDLLGDWVITVRCDEPVGGNILLQNECSSPVRVALGYLNTADEWEYVKWWEIGAETNTFLAGDAGRLVSNNSVFYYYAETTDGSNYVWKGDRTFDFQGLSLDTRELKLSRDLQGDWVIAISCD